MDNQNQITYEAALEVVKAKMLEGVKEIQSKGHFRGRLMFSVSEGPCDFHSAEFTAFCSDDQMPSGPTLQSVIDAILSPDDARENRIIKLRAELAELEKAEASKGKETECQS